VIDKTSLGMGARLLRRRLLRPSMDLQEIESRWTPSKSSPARPLSERKSAVP
jgi:DNA mismatch repair ATPase MutS